MNRGLNIIMSNVGNMLMNSIQMGKSYESWSDEFSYSEIKDTCKELKHELSEVIEHLEELNIDELMTLGFRPWDDEGTLYLVPLWAYDLLPDGTELECINGVTAVKGRDPIDLDCRFGCISWGIKAPIIKEEL